MISVSTKRDGDVLTVVVSGDVDLATGPSVSDAIGNAFVVGETTTVLVDLSGVTFLDSSGIAVLLQARRDADERSIAFRVFGARGIALQVLEVTGVMAHLSGEPSTEDPTAQ